MRSKKCRGSASGKAPQVSDEKKVLCSESLGSLGVSTKGSSTSRPPSPTPATRADHIAFALINGLLTGCNADAEDLANVAVLEDAIGKIVQKNVEKDPKKNV